MAKAGQMDAVKIMAKDLVRTRKAIKKFMLMKANIQAVSLKIQTLKSQNSMAQAMKGVTKATRMTKRKRMLLSLKYLTSWDFSLVTSFPELTHRPGQLQQEQQVEKYQLL